MDGRQEKQLHSASVIVCDSINITELMLFMVMSQRFTQKTERIKKRGFPDISANQLATKPDYLNLKPGIHIMVEEK